MLPENLTKNLTKDEQKAFYAHLSQASHIVNEKIKQMRIKTSQNSCSRLLMRDVVKISHIFWQTFHPIIP